MKFLQVLALGGAMAFASPAPAEATFDSAQLGHMKGVLDVCAKLNPREASDYLLQMKRLIGDATKDMVAEAAMTGEYQQAYQSITAELSSMVQEEMSKACSAYLVH